MASLRSTILDGRFASVLELKPDDDEVELQHAGIARYQLASRDTILVNATDVARDLFSVEEGWANASQIPSPKPPFRKMWIEMNLALVGAGGRRFGCLVQRIDVAPGGDPIEAYVRRNLMQPINLAPANGKDRPEFKSWIMQNPGATIEAFSQVHDIDGWEKHPLDLREYRTGEPFERITRDSPATLVNATVWEEAPQVAGAAVSGVIFYWLDGDGAVKGSYWQSWPDKEAFPDASAEKPRAKLGWAMLWTMHTFARLNCHNVELAPMKSGAPSPKQIKKHGPPATVWHEIVVKRIERRTARATTEGEKRELRFHKVRGHYADYTQGRGLFGRWKVRIWVDEHEAGKSELGAVVSSYRVE